ncbi:MAG: PPC domain-containing DNA-binding protein [Candidatus Peregrinibacteria bacterium]
MKSKSFGHHHVIRMDKGDEIVSTLVRFCKDHAVQAGLLMGIGAAEKITIGYFDVNTKKYNFKELDGRYEITSLLGNVAVADGEPALHLHINVADAQHRVFGGHLSSAVVSVTCEVVLHPFEGDIQRELSSEFPLKLFKF